jgi:hypothetical protein
LSIDEQPVALPKLYGAPAYARPRAPVTPAPRPFDPDLLPLQVYQTEEEREYAGRLRAHAYGTGGGLTSDEGGPGGAPLRPRRFRLREIAGRLLGGD